MAMMIMGQRILVPATSILLCTATIVTGSVLFYTVLVSGKQKRQKQSKDDKEVEGKVTSHELSNMEALFYKFNVPPITTITWFKGDYREAKLHLECRMKEIMIQNLWLCGRISTSGIFKGACKLSYTKPSPEASSSDMNVDEYLIMVDPALSPISRDMSLSSQNYTLLHSDIYLSRISIRNKPKEPIFRLTLIPCSKNPNGAFALVYQMSHIAGDGATYYKMMDMLCNTDDDDDEGCNPIVELIPERIKETKNMQIEIMGAAEENFLTSFGFTLVNILGMIMNQWVGRVPVEYAFIDPMHVQALKKKTANKEEAGIPYVSTNDVLTSHIISNSNSTYGMMAINWRNRLVGHTTLHAGNYENLILYRKEDASSPALIRKSLDSYKRVVTRNTTFPSWWEVANTTFTCVTNWSTFAKPNVIGGCVEDVHFPLILAEALPSHRLRMFVIFRSGMGKKIGICYPRGVLSVGDDVNDPFGLMK